MRCCLEAAASVITAPGATMSMCEAGGVVVVMLDEVVAEAATAGRIVEMGSVVVMVVLVASVGGMAR